MIFESKVQLIEGQSPLEFLPRLSDYLNGPKIYIKRDDVIGRSSGGNKFRKYERIIGNAISNNCDTLIIAGHYQSNAARGLVGAACQLGLQSVVVCKDLIPNQNTTFLKNGNALLMNIMGAKIVQINKEDDYTLAMNIVARQIKKAGGRPYIIPFGGSNVLGSLGYADCVDEMYEQSQTLSINFPDYIFTAMGSGGTQAGLISGILRKNIPSKVVGISVLHKKEEAEKIVRDLTIQTLTELKINITPDKFINIDDTFIGEGYGITTPESIETIQLLARLEGIFLCPVYTAKAMTGLLTYIRTSKIRKNESVVFLHSGGSPLLFAYYDKFFN